MTERATFFNSENGDRIYNADSMRQYISTFFTDGIHQGEFAPSFLSGMTIMVGAGYTVINGDVRYFPNQTRVTLEIADALYGRIDTIVLEHNENTREITIKPIKGDYSETPEPKAPVRTGGIYQLVIAQISVPAATLELSQSLITDTRANTDICGYIASKFEDIDFSQLTAQFSKYFEDTKAEDLAEFNAWLENECVDISESDYNTKNATLDDCDDEITELSGDMTDLITDLDALKTEADGTTISSSSKMKAYTSYSSVSIPYYNLVGLILTIRVRDLDPSNSNLKPYVVTMHMTSPYSESATSVTFRGYFTYVTSTQTYPQKMVMRSGYLELTASINRDTSNPKNSTFTFTNNNVLWYTNSISIAGVTQPKAMGSSGLERPIINKGFKGTMVSNSRTIDSTIYALYS